MQRRRMFVGLSSLSSLTSRRGTTFAFYLPVGSRGMSEGTVKKVLLCADGRDEHCYTIVLCNDGSYAIGKDGRLMPSHRWSSNHLDDCLHVFIQLSGLKNGKI